MINVLDLFLLLRMNFTITSYLNVYTAKYISTYGTLIMNRELFEAYKNTTYLVYSPIGEIDIRIGVMNPLLKELLLNNNVDSWAFMTAYNPYSVMQDTDVNTILNTQLEDYLSENQYLFFKGIGVGDDDSWEPEASFMVLNIRKEDAIKLARQFKQNAIVVGVIGNFPELIDCLNE